MRPRPTTPRSSPSPVADARVDSMTRIVLGSASPRRRELCDLLGVEYSVRPAELDETPVPGEHPVAYVARLAIEKAAAVARLELTDGRPDVVVIAADTTVEIDGEILGKPADAEEVRSMLRKLAGRTHRVHTGVAVRRGTRTEHGVSTTAVTFAPLSDERIEWYVGTGEAFDKAGGYALQGAGGVLVEGVDGSVSGVIGLPLALVVRLLQIQGVPVAGRAAGDQPEAAATVTSVPRAPG